jgi:hypothetical protein
MPPEISAWLGLTRLQRDFSLAKLDAFAEISALASVASVCK